LRAPKAGRKKTYNNGVSALRCAFAFGYKDHPEASDPAEGLDGFRITKKDRRKVDPFTLLEAERLIRGIHIEWGEAIGNDDEFRFFTGLSQSEQIALTTQDCDLEKGTINVHHVVVRGRAKDRTKTNEDRTGELCPRALAILKRQLALRVRLIEAGLLQHDSVFCKADGQPIHCIKHVYGRWGATVDRLNIRYRAP
jgi:integrase